MATVTQVFAPEDAQYKTTAFPQFVVNQGTAFPVSGLAFDATTEEAAFFKLRAANYGSGNLTVTVVWYADTGTSGTVTWIAQLAAITPDTDTQDTETKALATLNFVQDTHLGTTGQRLQTCAITVSNLDSIAAGDVVWLRLARDAGGTNATDTMTGDAIVVQVAAAYSDT